MKRFASALFLALVVVTASAMGDGEIAPGVDPNGMNPIVGSCTPSSLGDDWVECDMKSGADGSIHRRSVQKNVVLCSDLKGYQDDPSCKLSSATCALSHPYFEGSCNQQMPVDGEKYPTAQDACESVVKCLNDYSCATFYCRNTGLRGGWTLNSATENPPSTN